MESKLVVFKGKQIRRTLHNDEWWFAGKKAGRPFIINFWEKGGTSVWRTIGTAPLNTSSLPASLRHVQARVLALSCRRILSIAFKTKGAVPIVSICMYKCRG